LHGSAHLSAKIDKKSIPKNQKFPLFSKFQNIPSVKVMERISALRIGGYFNWLSNAMRPRVLETETSRIKILG